MTKYLIKQSDTHWIKAMLSAILASLFNNEIASTFMWISAAIFYIQSLVSSYKEQHHE